jgi:hypothetical protein
LVEQTLWLCSEASTSAAALSLPHMEALLGDEIFAQMMMGAHPYLAAALKSLPLRGDGAAADGGERDLAARLLDCCTLWLDGACQGVHQDGP